MKKWLISFTLLVLGLISLIFDEKIIFLFSQLRIASLSHFFLGIEFISATFFLAAFLIIISILFKKSRLSLWFSIGSTAIIGILLKILFKKSRPYQDKLITVVADKLASSSHLIWSFSFPSVHAMLAFATFPVIVKHFPRFKITWLIFAILICISRVYLGVHYASDVLIGAALGYLLGNLGIKISNSKFIKKNKITKKLF